MSDGPLIVQSDRTVLLEVAHPDAQSARHALGVFAELERAPEHMHTYRLTRLGLWNARAAGHTADEIISTLGQYAKFPIPAAVETDVRETLGRYGRLVITRDDDGLVLESPDASVLQQVAGNKKVTDLLESAPEAIPDGPGLRVRVRDWARGELKQQLLKLGWPAEDTAGYTPGTPHPMQLDEDGWQLRDYQRDAVEHFLADGSGVVVLPCGAGKTIVGAAAMTRVAATTLILVTNTVSALSLIHI